MQQKPPKLDIHGIILLDKPTNMSSNKALQIVKRTLNAKKAGHTGALDPLATGLLPLCFGQATKMADFLLGQNKTYLVTAKLGERTTTSDSEGEIIATKDIPQLNTATIENYLDSFRGEIIQTPSMYSALKFQGKPYYYYARKGIDIERVSRPVTIIKNELLELTADTLTLRVQCTKGTYIRTLIDDLGELIGCGAHVIALRREQIDGIQGDMVSMDQLEENNTHCLAALLSPTTVLDCDKYVLTKDEEIEFVKGRLKEIITKKKKALLALISENGQTLGYAQYTKDNFYSITRRFIYGFGTTGL